MRNKYKFSLLSLLILVFFVSACSGTSTGSTGTTGTSDETTSLSQVNLLLLGTLTLEDTDQAVTVEEAAELLPLWQAYRSISRSDTAAEAEVSALVNQIQAAMTTDQVQSIQEMDLTTDDLMAMLQALGGGALARGTPNPLGTPGANLPREGFPMDAPQGAGGGGGGGGGGMGPIINGGSVPFGGAGFDAGVGGGQMLQGTPDPSMQATAQARFASRSNQANNLLLEVLISQLEALLTQ